jgi:hypothetical protein
MHKKEVDYSIVIIIVMVCIGVIFFGFLNYGGVTGKAVFQLGDEETLEDKVTELANKFPLTRYAGDGAEVCLLIDVGNNEVYSYQIYKNAGVIEVTSSPFSRYCSNDINNEGSEDIVIKYVDYDSFLDHLDDPTCAKFVRGGAGEDFYFLPSELVIPGGTPVCNNIFSERYCPAVAQCLSKREMHLKGFDCCIEKKGIYALPAVFWDIRILVATIGVLLILVVLTGGVVVHKYSKYKELDKRRKDMLLKGRKELETYIKETKDMGFDRAAIEKHLLQIGWKKEDIDRAFEKLM